MQRKRRRLTTMACTRCGALFEAREPSPLCPGCTEVDAPGGLKVPRRDFARLR
jgi:hypothetical protein